jgi:hypothetical protein
MPMARVFACLALLGVFAVPAAAQARVDDRWQITLDNGGVVWDVRLKQLSGDQLQVSQQDSLIAVKVGDIREMRRFRKSEMQVGQGSTAGAMAALTGSDDEVFDFAPLDFGGRLRAVQQILLQSPTTQGPPSQ